MCHVDLNSSAVQTIPGVRQALAARWGTRNKPDHGSDDAEEGGEDPVRAEREERPDCASEKEQFDQSLPESIGAQHWSRGEEKRPDHDGEHECADARQNAWKGQRPCIECPEGDDEHGTEMEKRTQQLREKC